MINVKNSCISFCGKASMSKILLPTLGLVCCLNTLSAKGNTDTFEKSITNPVECVDSVGLNNNKTRLSEQELKDAPSPIVKVAGKNRNAGIVVDISKNRLYRYDDNGDVLDGYKIASGVIGRNGKSITSTGLRMVDHIETYPYKCAPGSKRARNPKAYGPNILYLTIVDSKTGGILGTNGEFIHGNNDASSIGKYASHGCIRMDNDVIKQFAKEVKKGTLVLIKD